MRIVPTFLGDSFRSAQRTRLNGFMQGIHESSSFSAVELWLPCDHDELRCVYASVARPQLLPWTQLCLEMRDQLQETGLRVWQQATSIPKDSDNWFTEW